VGKNDSTHMARVKKDGPESRASRSRSVSARNIPIISLRLGGRSGNRDEAGFAWRILSQASVTDVRLAWPVFRWDDGRTASLQRPPSPSSV